MRLGRAWSRVERRFFAVEGFDLGWLVLLTLGLTALVVWDPMTWPLLLLVVPMVLGSIVLGPRQLPWFIVFVLAALSFTVTQQDPLTRRIVVGVITEFLLGFIFLVSSFRRSSLGVGGARGESMLVDLRDRIQSQGMLPPLPSAWYAESALRSAGGTPFAGDFVVASRHGQGPRLDLAVVDVSGKGEAAGTRSLLLSGAFSGLLGAVPPEEFLPAANDYLLRQHWDEGFATAVHLCVDLETGDFALRTAGHPPAVQLFAGAGRWQVHETEGPVLGLFREATYEPAVGRLHPGDAMMLYTDGMVETPNRDIALGIDRLVGQAERLLRQGFDDGARRLIDRLGSRNDDRALLLLHRR